MKESLYIDATRRAWRFVWHHKILWVFGIFAAFLGQFGIVDFLGKISVFQVDTDKYFGAFGNVAGAIWRFVIKFGISFDSKLLLVFLAVLFLALVSIFIFVAVSSQGAIINAVFQAEKKDKVDISRAWHVGTANFWRLFLLNFFREGSVALIAILVGLSVLSALGRLTLGNSVFFILTFLLLAAAGLVVSFLFFYTAAYIVIGKFSVYASLTRAWKLLVGHWLVSFEIGVVILVFNLFLGLFTALVFALAILPAILIWFAIILWGGSYNILVSAFMAVLVFFTMYLMLVGAGFTVFTSYIWTYAFLKMDRHGLKSKVLELLHKMKR